MIYWHIGYPKTGTTFLQKLIFPRIKEINYVGRKLDLPKRNDRIINYLLNKIRPLKYRKFGRYFNEYYLHKIAYDDQFDFDEFSAILNKKLIQNKVNLISSEGFFDTVNLERTIKRIMKVSKNLNFDYRILITIRKPSDIILSRYMHDVSMVNEDKRYSMESVIRYDDNMYCTPPQCKFFNKCLCGINRNIHISDYKYEKIFSRIENVLNEKKLIIWKYEDIFKDIDRVIFSTFNIKTKFNYLLENKINFRSKKEKEMLLKLANNEKIINKLESDLKY